MDPIEIPENLGELNDEALDELSSEIRARVEELAADVTEENVAEMERLGAAFADVRAEQRVREEAAAALADRAAQAQAALAVDETEPVEDETTVVAAPAEPEADAELAAAVTTPQSEVLVPEITEPILEAAAKPRGSALIQQMSASVPEVITPAAPVVPGANQTFEAGFVAAPNVPSIEAGTSVDTDSLAAALTRKRLSFSRIPAQVKGEKVVVASASIDWGDHYLTGDPEANFGRLRDVQRGTKSLVASGLSAIKREGQALVASGGCCAPAAPRYDIFRTAVPHSPVEDSLPVVGAPRGSVRFVRANSVDEALGGVGVTPENCGDGGSGSGDTEKPCYHATCPDIATCSVDAVSTCIEFGNLPSRVFPELVASDLVDLAVAFAATKEILYLDTIDAAADWTATTGAGYGQYRRLFRDAVQAATNYRIRNNMDVDAPLDWYVPIWAVEVVKLDVIADHALGVDYMGITSQAVAAALAAVANLNVVWYYHSATGEGQQWSTEQEDGALNAFPTDMVSYIHAPGTYVRLDAGTLDVGLVRDSTLNARNDYQMFAEQWVNACKFGLEGGKVVHEDFGCPTGVGPAAATAITCTGDA